MAINTVTPCMRCRQMSKIPAAQRARRLPPRCPDQEVPGPPKIAARGPQDDPKIWRFEAASTKSKEMKNEVKLKEV